MVVCFCWEFCKVPIFAIKEFVDLGRLSRNVAHGEGISAWLGWIIHPDIRIVQNIGIFSAGHPVRLSSIHIFGNVTCLF